MPPAMQASPITWMPGSWRDSKVTGSIGHQPVRSATPAACAIAPARCGGMTLSDVRLVPAEVGDQRLVRRSHLGDLAAGGEATHSTMPG